jgi:hypothetical protein
VAGREDDKAGRKATGEAAGQASTEAGSDTAFTPGGAPTDEAHQAAGDGTLTGSVPAGLTVDEMLDRAAKNPPNNPGSE